MSRSAVATLVERTQAAFDKLPIPAELVLIDDGSRDATWPTLETLAALHPPIRALRLRRNFGKATALMLGGLAFLGFSLRRRAARA